MPTHTMTCNANSTRINLILKCLKDCRGQFLGYVAVHVVSFVVGRECSVDIEAGAGTKVVCVVFALDVQTTYLESVCTFRFRVCRVGETDVDWYQGTRRQFPSYSRRAERSPFPSSCRPCMSVHSSISTVAPFGWRLEEVDKG